MVCVVVGAMRTKSGRADEGKCGETVQFPMYVDSVGRVCRSIQRCRIRTAAETAPCSHPTAFVVGNGSKKPEYCSQHAKASMVNVENKKRLCVCGHHGCAEPPSYGVNDGSKKAEYCSQHAIAGMVNIKNKRCGH